MKHSILTLTCAIMLAGSVFAQTETTPTVDSAAPVVVKTLPEACAKDFAAGEMEIKVTFSKEMTDNSWSWSSAWKVPNRRSLANRGTPPTRRPAS